MFYDAREGDIEVCEGKVHYISFGKGKRNLVMIPGLRLSNIAGSAKALAMYYRMFANDYTVYMFDRKDNISEGYTIHDIAEDTVKAIEKTGLNEAYLYGASQGGMISQDMAVNHPGLIKKMVLAVTLSKYNETVNEAVRCWLELAKSGDLTEVAKDYTYKGFSEGYLQKYKAFIPFFIKNQKYMPVERFVILAKACLTCDTFDRLEEIKCPVLVLGGGKDKIVSKEASIEIAQKLGCECYIYEDLGHEAYSEAKDFNKRIFEFFKE